MNLRVPEKEGNFLTSERLLTSRGLLHADRNKNALTFLQHHFITNKHHLPRVLWLYRNLDLQHG
jgi:hypothetical protein